MKLAILLGFIIALLVSCTPLPVYTLEEPMVYMFKKEKNDLVKSLGDQELARLVINWKDKACSKAYESPNLKACFTKIGRGTYPVALIDKSTDQIEGNFTQKSTRLIVFETADGELYEFTTSREQLLVHHKGQFIALVKRSKNRYRFEILPTYSTNDLLLAALLFQQKELIRNTEQSNNDLMVMFLILPIVL